MEVTITLRDIEDRQIEIEENRLPYSGETVESVTVATVLADDILAMIESLGESSESPCES